MRTLSLRLSLIAALLPVMTIYCMEEIDSKSYTMYAEHPITTWPRYLFDNAFPGANYNFSLLEEFPGILELARIATKQQADAADWPKDRRKVFDWIYTLELMESTLLIKPFASWTVEDIRQLACSLTRLHSEHREHFRAPHYRSRHKAWQLTDDGVSDADAAKLLAIGEKGGPQNEAEYNFCSKITYFTPSPGNLPPFDLESQLSLALYITQKCLIKAHLIKDTAERIKQIVDCAAFIHFETIRIQPFTHGNLRLGRLLAHVIFAQSCIKPFCFDYCADYKNALHQQLTDDRQLIDQNPSPTAVHFMQLLNHSETCMQVFHKHLFKVNEDFKAALKKKGGAVILQQLTQSLKKLRLSFCAGCNEKESDECKLSLCGRCQDTAYCSKECQKSDWAKHKKTCIPINQS